MWQVRNTYLPKQAVRTSIGYTCIYRVGANSGDAPVVPREARTAHVDND
jgi:hypothetical protein